MRSWAIAAVGLLAVVVVAGLSYRIGGTSLASSSHLISAPSVYGVEELMTVVEFSDSGTTTVEGVVGAASVDQGMFTLIDKEEFIRCQLTTCAPLSLPVRWEGVMPSPSEAVRATGEIEESGGKLLFVARHLEVVTTQPPVVE